MKKKKKKEKKTKFLNSVMLSQIVVLLFATFSLMCSHLSCKNVYCTGNLSSCAARCRPDVIVAT